MKKIITLFLSLNFVSGYSQFFYQHNGNNSIKREKIVAAKLMSDIIPEYPQEYYNTIIDYLSVEISSSCDNKTLTSTGTSEALTAEQKNVLYNADFGTDIFIKITFKYKDAANDAYGSGRKIKEMGYAVRLNPETEAQYPGGYDTMDVYLKEKVINKISGTTADKTQRVSIPKTTVAFTVNEEGKIINAKISHTSSDPIIDNLLLEAVNKMPNWKPAQNLKGEKVKQKFEVSIPYPRRGC